MNTLELARKHPEAFAALPEAYQADNCLTFDLIGGELYCWPGAGQQEALGVWTMKYINGEWKEI